MREERREEVISEWVGRKEEPTHRQSVCVYGKSEEARRELRQASQW